MYNEVVLLIPNKFKRRGKEMTESKVILRSELPGIPVISRGKVRDLYQVDDQRLLFVASDRISAFDVIMPNGIPDKGRILTQMSLFWFEKLGSLVGSESVRNHLISANTSVYPKALQPFSEVLNGRSMLVRKLKILPIECIVRGYLAGSGWKEYQKSGTVCGIKLPAGLRESDKLPEPIFTPSTKAESGHDENIPFSVVVDTLGVRIAEQVKNLSISVYQSAADYARMRGIIIADTKFEFGMEPGADNLTLADEVLTPDSSRFWDLETYQPGKSQDSFDKQYLRDYLETLDWNKEPPAPQLPDEVVVNTRAKYMEAFRRLTGKELA
jgi:phosphoribosylaminoimidazole-succinocarboxamide synthase